MKMLNLKDLVQILNGRFKDDERSYGSRSVKDDETLGSLETCWCGEPMGHDWPGKATGAVHPPAGGWKA